jgi:hypothetical protein
MSAELKEKACEACGETKPRGAFIPSGKGKAYLSRKCRECYDKAKAPLSGTCGLCERKAGEGEWDAAKGCCVDCAAKIDAKPEPRIRPVEVGGGYVEFSRGVDVEGSTREEAMRWALARIADDVQRRENGGFVGSLGPLAVRELAQSALARADELPTVAAAMLDVPDKQDVEGETAELRARIRALEAERAEIVAAVAPLVDGDEAARQLVRLGMRLAR